jgi:hypothetical protein
LDSLARGPEDTGMYLVRRSHETLAVHAQLDSGDKIILIKPRNSFAFWANVENYCVGMLVDRDNPKRYGYRRWSYLALKDTTVTVRRFAPIPKGTMHFSFSVPVFNAFSLKSPEGQTNLAGPLGLEAGVDYFYKTDRYLSLSAGVATSVFAEHIGNGYYQTGHVLFGSLRNNYVIGSFELGYGFSYSDLLWSRVKNGDTVKLDHSIKSVGLGCSLSAQYRIGPSFRFCLLYQPVLFTANRTPAFGYQHYLSAGLAWRWRVRR